MLVTPFCISCGELHFLFSDIPAFSELTPQAHGESKCFISGLLQHTLLTSVVIKFRLRWAALKQVLCYIIQHTTEPDI